MALLSADEELTFGKSKKTSLMSHLLHTSDSLEF